MNTDQPLPQWAKNWACATFTRTRCMILLPDPASRFRKVAFNMAKFREAREWEKATGQEITKREPFDIIKDHQDFPKFETEDDLQRYVREKFRNQLANR